MWRKEEQRIMKKTKRNGVREMNEGKKEERKKATSGKRGEGRRGCVVEERKGKRK